MYLFQNINKYHIPQCLGKKSSVPYTLCHIDLEKVWYLHAMSLDQSKARVRGSCPIQTIPRLYSTNWDTCALVPHAFTPTHLTHIVSTTDTVTNNIAP